MKLIEEKIKNLKCENTRLSTASFQGGRKYMEDEYAFVHYSPAQNEGKENANPMFMKSFVFVGIFDGHGGDTASKYSRDNLCHNIIRQHDFWSDDDRDVCRAIHLGFVNTQRQMHAQVDNWPKTSMGHMSTAGTTASIIFIMNGKYYTGHVGDSRIILARENKTTKTWDSYPLTKDHKPNAPEEQSRIEKAGGKVVNKSGVSRVVWKRLKYSADRNKPASTDFDVIPFLAVARALGDLWSYNPKRDLFVVSPEPDVNCFNITSSDQCLILASDGLWNMINNQVAVNHVRNYEKGEVDDIQFTSWDTSTDDVNHSSFLVEHCMKKWSRTKYRADNITVVTLMLDFDRNSMKAADAQIRTDVDDEGNHFASQLIGKMFNEPCSDEDSNDSSDDDEGDNESTQESSEVKSLLCELLDRVEKDHEASLVDNKPKYTVFSKDQMVDLQFTDLITSESFQGFQDSYHGSFSIDSRIFGIVPKYHDDNNHPQAINNNNNNHNSSITGMNISHHLHDRSMTVINHNDLSFFHQFEELNNSSTFATETKTTPINGGAAGVVASFASHTIDILSKITSLNSENVLDSCVLKRKVDCVTDIGELGENDCKAVVAKKLCALNLSCEQQLVDETPL